MTDDMGFDLKLPTVGELTFPQWQDWLVRYNVFIGERDARIDELGAANDKLSCDALQLYARIEKLEAALRDMLSKCTWEKRRQWCGSMGCHCQIARKALEGKDGE